MHSLEELIELNDSSVKTPVKTDFKAQYDAHLADQKAQYATLIDALRNDARIAAVYQGPEVNYLNFGQTGEVTALSDKGTSVFYADGETLGFAVRAKNVWIPHFQRTLSTIIKEAE